jgi:hypothetical protein
LTGKPTEINNKSVNFIDKSMKTRGEDVPSTINEIIEGVKGLLVSFHGQGLLIYHKNLLIKSS